MFKKRILQFTLALGLMATVTGSIFAYKAYRMGDLAFASEDHFRYLYETGDELVGNVKSDYALSSSYLSAVFGDNQKLLDELNRVVVKGLNDPTKLQLDTVTGMLVTYRQDENGDVKNLVTHIIGGLKPDRRKPGFHRDGYFKHLIDRNLWDAGNTILGFLGANIVYYAEEEDIAKQQALISSTFTGEIDLVMEAIKEPYSYTLVLPNPRRLLPPQLRHHIQTIIVRGSMHLHRGNTEIIMLCAKAKSAKYAVAVIEDMKNASETILKTKFGGRVQEEIWGPSIDSWWAYEMVMTSEKALIAQEENIVRINAVYGRVMNNAILKSVERMGRDLRQITGSLEEKLDPRLVDAQMKTRKGSHYWSDNHRWGPNWPIGLPEPEEDQAAATTPSP